jgi:streptogramin lyase
MGLFYNEDLKAFTNDYNKLMAIDVIAGEDLLKGNVVYISDNAGAVPVANLALASDPTKMPAIGVVLNGHINQGNQGHVVTFGEFTVPPLSPFQEGETLYVSNTHAGGLMNTKPINTVTPDLIQNVGILIDNAGGNSKFLVTGVGRANDIPNANVLSDDSTVKYVYVNTEGNDLKKIDPAKLVTGPLTLSVTGTSMFPESNVVIKEIMDPHYTDLFAGGVLASNGKIYFVPRNASNVGVIDPINDTYTTIADGQVSSDGNKYYGGVIAPNGKIYCVPRDASNVGVIDPFMDTFTTISGPSTDTSKYFGGVLGPNGKIYCVPFNASNVGVIDTVTDTFTILLGPSTDNGKYYGGALAPDGKIYCVPYTASNVGVIDPSTDSFTTIASAQVTSDSSKYSSGVLAPNGKIYCVPRDASNVGVIDPFNSSFTTIASAQVTSDARKYDGGTLAPNGKIYCVPHNASNVGVIDPVDDTFTIVADTSFAIYDYKYSGGVLAPNGKIYCVPDFASNVAIIKTGIPTEGSWILQPEFNKL